MSDFDILIVGGGIAGASLGARVASTARTVIIEAEQHCAMHATGRSAAFWLAHYGGAPIIPLTMASRQPLMEGWPVTGRSLLRDRGALVIAREYMDLRDALSVETEKAPRRELVDRAAIERLVPGIREGWANGLYDPTCADIDVAALHQNCIAQFHRDGGTLLCDAPLQRARRWGDRWAVETPRGQITATTIVNAAGAWADSVAELCGARALDVRPYRRTIVQLRVARNGVRDLPLVIDAFSRFYFKGESDNRVWVSPHDETLSEPCDASPEEIDVARAVDHFESVVDWPIEAVERKWAGLRTFTPVRVPAYGFDQDTPGFFWCVGQGGFGVQTAPAGSAIAASLLLQEDPEEFVRHVDASIYAPRRFG